MTIGDMKEQARDLFLRQEYAKALFYYSLILRELPEDKEARICAILADMAAEGDQQGQALFDYYLILKEENEAEAEEIIEDLLDSYDFHDAKFEEILQDTAASNAHFEDGITYEDFRELIRSRGSFRRAFEDIMFSTRVIISKKEEFIDFLENLIESGFDEIAMSYLESATMIFPNEKRLRGLFDKLAKGR